MTEVGQVAALWRYPVKSMQGEELESAAITERGIVGDRAYAVQDRETGHVASAKYPRKWSRLFECRAVYRESPRPGAPLPPVSITLPDGATIRSDDAEIDQVLSHTLGRAVTLISQAPEQPTREADRTPIDAAPGEEVIQREPMALAAPPGTFFDYAPLHLLTTATLDRLRTLYPTGRFEPRRFRPNIVLATESMSGFAENDWLRRDLSLGTAATFRAIDPCPRCVVTTLPQDDLPRDPGILRTIAQNNSVASATLAPGVVLPAVAGIYLSVTNGGTLRRGDPLLLR